MVALCSSDAHVCEDRWSCSLCKSGHFSPGREIPHTSSEGGSNHCMSEAGPQAAQEAIIKSMNTYPSLLHVNRTYVILLLVLGSIDFFEDQKCMPATHQTQIPQQSDGLSPLWWSIAMALSSCSVEFSLINNKGTIALRKT